MELGTTTEAVTVTASAVHVETEAHAVSGVITRQEIQELPLNGRSFLQLAFLEPGVTANPGSTSQYNSLFSVSILGGDSSKTAITVDGGNIRNNIEGNTGMNFSQEVVQEFQLSSTNFDLSTGITSVGAVNIVTRTGSNDLKGSAYFFFRNNDLAAYPALRRDPLAPDPEFARRNPGAWVGGPLRRDRLFYFTNYEYTSQDGVVSYQPNLASAAALAGVFDTPYRGHLFSTRADWRVNNRHNAFVRFSHDENSGFGPSGGPALPSNWLRNVNRSEQSVVGLTSIFTPTLLNDFRFNFTYWRNRNLFSDDATCGDCIGLGMPQLNINGTNVTVGNTSNATQGRDLYRYTFVNTLTWVKGEHRLRFGTELEHAPGTGFWGFCDPACTVGLSPEFTRSVVPAALLPALFPNLPTQIRTDADLLNLPLAGAAVGVGDPGQPPPYNIDKAKPNNRMRLYAPHAQLRSGVELREHPRQSRPRQARVSCAALWQRPEPDEQQLQQLVAVIRLRLDARRRQQDRGARRRRTLLGDRAAVAPPARTRGNWPGRQWPPAGAAHQFREHLPRDHQPQHRTAGAGRRGAAGERTADEPHGRSVHADLRPADCGTTSAACADESERSLGPQHPAGKDSHGSLSARVSRAARPAHEPGRAA
jgi:hypothetical protein